RGTTGLVVVAKHKLACALLEGRIEKEYLCLCEGVLPASGVYDGPIAVEEAGRLRRVVRADGKPAVTHFERLRFGEDWSMARVWLETGRTHQIRCHFADAGHPLLGDFLYGTETEAWSRPALHCAQIRFPHPVTGRRIECRSELPRDMADFLSKDR
ncbi:MAG: RNA pseudouridine synthase, partial [Clostridia bacterium]|nr:RNA pseudouridine synthase [Clostridia bacterium]